MKHLPFLIEATEGSARAATLSTPHGEVQTPVFMPVGTQGAIRSLSPLHLSQPGSQIILANTYHLSQRPGEHLVAKHGGVHKMMDGDLPILTDSGGFHVFSLKKTHVIEEGVGGDLRCIGRATSYLAVRRQRARVQPAPVEVEPLGRRHALRRRTRAELRMSSR